MANDPNPFTGLTAASYQPGANSHFATGQSDGSFERYQRESGSYEAGAMPELSDQIAQGSDEQA